MEKLRMNNEEKSIILKAIENYLEKINKFSEINISGTELKKVFLDKNITKPTLAIPSDIYTKMFMYVDLSPVEIEWHGLVKRDKENQIYTIYDILMFPQENTSTHTDTDDEEYMKWLMGKMSESDFPMQDLRLHGHSHVNMNVFSSATDDTYQNDLIANIDDGDYYIFMILNKKREMFVLIYDFDQQILFSNKDIDIIIPDKNGVDILTECKAEYKKNCRVPTKSYYYPAKTNPKYTNSLDDNKKGKKHGSYKK